MEAAGEDGIAGGSSQWAGAGRRANQRIAAIEYLTDLEQVQAHDNQLVTYALKRFT